MNAPPKPYFTQALDALKRVDRRAAAALLDRELRHGNTSVGNLPSVAELALHIGEVNLAVEASRRAVQPGSAGSLMAYWATLARCGRSAEALADAERQPAAINDAPAVLHFRGTVANQFGRFEEAEELFRRTLARDPAAMHSWFALAMVKTFAEGDPDIAAMERLEAGAAADPDGRAALCYALGKAWEDCGDLDRAFHFYTRGAALRRLQRPFDIEGFRRAAERVVREFTPDNLGKLTPSGFNECRTLFVTGLPRSGTTLTEQILLSHSSVADGAELNLFPIALMPTLGPTIDRALGYQQRSGLSDPWGEIAADYAGLVDLRLPARGHVIDKSLSQSLVIGLMLHAMPGARIAWLRRSPDDVALSCFRTYFSDGLPWTWSLTDIADYMRAEDELFAHWSAMFPDRILAVPYEELVGSPASWAERLQQHFGLAIEPGLETVSREGRTIGTASVGQVGEPISPRRVGRAAAFERQLKPFRDRYYR